MKKILIANRGEIACRVIKSCKKLGIKTVAVYSTADENSLHVELADEAYHIGPAKAAESYLQAQRVLDVCLSANVDAVHPGYGFLSENCDFANLLEKHNIRWIGPSPDSIQDMGDKERARAIAVGAGVPVLPGSIRFSCGDVDGVLEAANEVGFPLLVKASAGGGGIGMRLVEEPSKLIATVESTQKMAERSFGDGTIFMERYVARARHIEIQVFGFGDGRAVHLYERECSIQRRFQKILEESPAPGIPAEVKEKMATAALSLTRQQKYSGAGTVEFILDADTFEFFFLEMNTRIQVEHPVTEMTTNTDLVSMQIQLALGEDLSHITQNSIKHKGHAIEARIYAEDPSRMFLPTPGEVTAFAVPGADEDPNVRLDTGIRAGDKITAYYDPMIAKLICFGPSRTEALNKLEETLKSMTLDGVGNNVEFLGKTINHQEFVDMNLFTGFIDKFKTDLL
ncbi:biotin carboxylase N-terminal domain-containing protein [uncultured Amphritea sp.]|uniref:acetyl-CoA carboxylase biotin carboxylase subunit n=1 Tax=uncultured Amphritea sp. TaxID=981605 RepID=UPI0025F1C906|nr:biotin carboxylase N-terminal domain-containing protein [uncultured Amphritea sp.]